MVSISAWLAQAPPYALDGTTNMEVHSEESYVRE
jgi:hypothetical protein